MAFGDLCDGYVVIHAHLVSAYRRPFFEEALSGVGISRITVLNGVPIADGDPFLQKYSGNKGHVSLIKSNIAAIDMAEELGWSCIAIFEDDIIFRRDFSKLWAEVEPAVLASDWDVLTLHRGPQRRLILKEPRGATHLLEISQNIWAQCVIVRASGFDKFRRALQGCLRRSYPADFFYGILSHSGGRIVTTSRNLTGQRGGFVSSITTTKARGDNFYESFRSCRTWIEWIGVTSAFRVKRIVVRAKAVLQRAGREGKTAHPAGD